MTVATRTTFNKRSGNIKKYYNADEILEQMRNDHESDWPDRLIDVMSTTQFPKTTLTPRQTDVLRCSAEGLTDVRTAEYLGIRIHTVHQHRTRAIRNLGATGLTHAVAISIRNGWL